MRTRARRAPAAPAGWALLEAYNARTGQIVYLARAPGGSVSGFFFDPEAARAYVEGIAGRATAWHPWEPVWEVRAPYSASRLVLLSAQVTVGPIPGEGPLAPSKVRNWAHPAPTDWNRSRKRDGAKGLPARRPVP